MTQNKIKLDSRDKNNIIELEYFTDGLFTLKMRNYNYDMNYRISEDKNNKGHYNFVDPDGGPMLTVGMEINHTNSSLKEDEKMIIKDIVKSKHFGILLECDYEINK